MFDFKLIYGYTEHMPNSSSSLTALENETIFEWKGNQWNNVASNCNGGYSAPSSADAEREFGSGTRNGEMRAMECKLLNP